VVYLFAKCGEAVHSQKVRKGCYGEGSVLCLLEVVFAMLNKILFHAGDFHNSLPFIVFSIQQDEDVGKAHPIIF